MSAHHFKVVIPARYASTRLPGKPLRHIAGRPMLQHVYDRVLQSGAEAVIIATDDPRIEQAAGTFSAGVCMTSPEHTSGTERLGEVVERMRWPDETIIVNVQGDEPLIPPTLISQVAEDLAAHPDAAVATLAHAIATTAEAQDPNVVKVVTDRSGYALYFSRAAVPFHRDRRHDDTAGLLRHIGLYAYRAGFLRHYRNLEPAPIERAEMLEQLRVLWHGMKIHVGMAAQMPGSGVDTEADLLSVEKIIKNINNQ
ncbi:MAG TPA: 3-deoxy-manno-octulosonate cytidylyltransferase [Gammaproteobacteria bacterium]|nr:3-deoxy-manno-octulosonate cytidylyltransferase [Gammaproteobacteria bacterium]